jgi:16S rRNA G1207 methylase RsmC
VHTEIAARMFRGAARHLTPQGSLTIVANRHLDYRPLLQPNFRQVKLISGNSKFVILSASGAKAR